MPQQPSPPEFLTVSEVAEELGVSRTVVTQLTSQGSLPAQRVSNGRLRFERGLFERWIRDQYAETRRWVLANRHDGYHGDWKDWPIGRPDDGGRPHTRDEGGTEASSTSSRSAATMPAIPTD
jgi:excisionase family DNA binding protein